MVLLPLGFVFQWVKKIGGGGGGGVNPFPNTPLWDCPKSNEAADDNWNVGFKGFWQTDCLENIVDKGEIAHFEQFHLFHNVFLKLFTSLC